MRAYTIQKVLFTYGLDELIPRRLKPWYMRLFRRCLFWLPNKHEDKPRGERLRLALQELGPVFVKFGQMLSTRRDLLPADIVDQLAILQDRVAPFDSELAKALICKELQLAELSQIFSDFEDVPLASASIAQVHTARLTREDAQVVVKVIRPGIENTIEADLRLMTRLARLVQRFLPDGKRLRPVEVVQEYRKTIIDELNLLQEATNGIQLKRNFDNSECLYIPTIYSDYCAQKVLVMERIEGIQIADVPALVAQNTNMKLLAERGVEVFFTQVFRDSFFHADMHPGNIFVSREHPDKPKYIAVDFGIVGTLNKDDKRYLAENFIAFFNRDYRKVAELHVDSGWVPPDTNIDEFEVAIRTVCEPIFQKPLAEISFAQVLIQLFNTARRFDMEVQPQLVLLQKTPLYVEGLGRQLYPQLDLWQTAKPFLEQWMQQQIGPKALWNRIKGNLPYWSEKLPEMPDLLHDALVELRAFPQLQLATQQQAMRQQRALATALVSALAGSTLVLAGILWPMPTWPTYAMFASGALCWLYGLKRLTNHCS